MSGLWQAHEPDLTELGERAERAVRFSWLSDPWVEIERHDPDDCICYLLPIFFNHVSSPGRQLAEDPCRCTGCEAVRVRWTGWAIGGPDDRVHGRMS